MQIKNKVYSFNAFQCTFPDKLAVAIVISEDTSTVSCLSAVK